MTEPITYQFLPWVRTGLGAALSTSDSLGAAPMAAVSRLSVRVPVLGGAPDVAAQTDVALLGPGDVVGIDPSQVVRTDPKHLATDAEPNFFPMVEFDRPDLPWMFSPAAPDKNDRLRPWICLLVLDRDGDDVATLVPGEPLPRLRIPAGAAGQLPNLAESWLWAHAQVIATAPGQEIPAALAADPRLNVSRLICPRRLSPHRRYLACVVPTFADGRHAGLGEDVPSDVAPDARLAPAFTPGQAVDIPVYYSFEFATGAAGDFETLARRLVGQPLPAGVGTRPLDVSRPGAGLPTVDDVTDPKDTRAVLGLDGALRAPRTPPTEWDQPYREAFEQRLTVLVDLPAKLAAQGLAAGPEGTEALTIAPPIYGRWHAATVELGSGTPPPWLREVNLDPRRRVAAGLGTAVVRAHQEDLMARAWRQVGDILDANRLLRAAQFARAAGAALRARHLVPLDPGDLVQVTAPVHRRITGVVEAGPATFRAEVPASRLPAAVAGTAFRRFARTGGPLARAGRFGPATMRGMVSRLAMGAIAVPVPLGVPDGTVTLSKPTAVLGTAAAAGVLAKLAGRPQLAGDDDRLDAYADVLKTAPVVPRIPERVAALPVRDDITLVSVLRPLGVTAIAEVPAPIRPVRGGQLAGLAASTVVGRASLRAFPIADVRGRVEEVLRDSTLRISVEATIPGAIAANLSALDRRARAVDAARIRSSVSIEDSIARGKFTARPAELVQYPSLGALDKPAVDALAAGLVQAYGRLVINADAPPAPPGRPLSLGAVRDAVLAKLDPEITVVARVAHRLNIAVQRDVVPDDPLADVLAAPAFHDPTWAWLNELSQEWLLPGLDKVPIDTVTLVETNPPLTEAYLVGLNHEMARELLWREYPTDRRGTYFTRFWGYPDTAEIGPVHRFTKPLGANLTSGPDPRLVLLVRGELLRRYPGAIIFASRGKSTADGIDLDDTTFAFPLFRGVLQPDVTYLGFDLRLDKITAPDEPDWWFVIAQQITEPRFGLDDYEPATFKPARGPGWTWDSLTWGHLAETPAESDALMFAPASVPGLGRDWGRDAAMQAHVCFQRPVRVAIKAKSLLTDEVLDRDA